MLLLRGAEGAARTPTQAAARGGHSGVVALLVEAGALPCEPLDTAGEGALHYAAARGDADMAKTLLAAGGDAALKVAAQRNARDQTVCHVAAYSGSAEVLGFLLAAGAAPDAIDAAGATPLHLAAAGGHGHACHALLEAGADAAARDAGGRTALFAAACAAGGAFSEAAVNALAQNRNAPASAAVHADSTGLTPLHAAARLGNAAAARALCAAGAEASVVDGDGATPLHAAAELGAVDVVEALLGAQASAGVIVRAAVLPPVLSGCSRPIRPPPRWWMARVAQRCGLRVLRATPRRWRRCWTRARSQALRTRMASHACGRRPLAVTPTAAR